MTRSPVDIIAAALCVPAPDGFCGRPNQHRRDAEAVLAALAGEGWTVVLRDEAFEVSCGLCDGCGELYGCAEDAPDICRSCDVGDLDHVIDCPRCDGNGDVMVVPLVPVEGEK